jgi:multicomponent Na+:H+ antiporter subunit F
MTTLWWIASIVLLLNIVVGTGFVTTRKGSPDSVLATLLFGTTGLALTLVLGKALNQSRAVDIALVFALLAAVLGVTFARHGWFPGGERGDKPS